MRRGILFSATMVALLLVIFFVGLHLLLVDFRGGLLELAQKKGEMMAREVALNLENYVNEKVDTVELLSSTLYPFYLEGKISSRDLYRGMELHMKHGRGVTNVQFFNRQGMVISGYPVGKALLGLRLDRDVKNRDFYRLFIQCLENKQREMRLIDTLFLDPFTMELKYKPLLVVMYPVMVGQNSRVEGVLMASLDISSLVSRSIGGSLLDRWRMAVLGPEGKPIWSSGGSEFLEDFHSRGKGWIRVEVPFRVVGGKWEVVASIPRKEVEGGIVAFYSKVKALISAFLFVLGLSLLSVYLEVKKSYRALALSEDRFRTLVENMKDVFYIRGRRGGVSYMSPGVDGKVGVSGEMLSKAISAFPPEEVERVLELGDRILEVKERERGEAFFGLVRDVTKERRLALRVERERKFLDGLLSSLGSGVMVLDVERRVVWMNSYLKEMFQLGGDTQGSFCFSLLAHRESPCPGCYLEALLEGEKSQEEGVKRYFVPLMGEERDLFIKVQEMSTQEGVRWVVIYQDITETRRMEERVYLMDKLSSLGKLAASVAHELSTPLSVTSTNLDLVLRKEKLTPSARRLLEVSAEELKRSVSLLQRLRWIYRPVTMKKEEVRIDRLLKDVMAVLRTFARERKVGLNLEVTPVRPFKGYREPLMQVLLNLVTNAVEASPAGGEVTLRAEEEEGTLLITVRDRGRGIPGHIMEHLFEPFVTGKRGGGAGLGLYLSHKLVESMGGSIEVESREGEGTAFTVKLPMEGEA